MKPFILVALLCVLCSYQPLRKYLSPENFGVYLAPDPNGKRMILIKSNYYVTEGKSDDLEAAKLGVDFWHGLNDQFFLLEMDSSGKITNEFLPIHFELKIVSCKDPLATQKLNDSLGKYRLPGAVILNTFFLKDDITDAGLTLFNSFSRVKKKHKKNVKVIAHEIGHTLGLEDRKMEAALMHEDTGGGTEVYEFDICTILKYSYRERLNWYQNHFDPTIPRGKIVHKSGRSAGWAKQSVEFLK